MCKNNTFKRSVSLIFMTLSVAATLSATVTYELNGGWTNDYGWQNKGDMFAAFMTDAGAKNFNTLDYYMQQADPLSSPNICYRLTDASPALQMAEKWGWLEAYVMQAHAAQVADGASELATGGAGAAWRYAVGAFFISGQRTDWPQSANFVLLGQDAAYIPAWKHAYANPTEPTDSMGLNAPYREEHTFVGWYTTADFSGEPVTYINDKTTGTLYAKWIDYAPNIVEVKALADGSETYIQGVVNYVEGNNVYIQDALGGIRICTKETPNCHAGQRIIAQGTKSVYNGIAEVKEAGILYFEEAGLYSPIPVLTLADLQKHTLTYLGQRIYIDGATITKYDKNFPVITDGSGTIVCYNMYLDEAEFPIGTRVTVTAVTDYYSGEFRLIGDTECIKKSADIQQDTYVYPTRGEKSEYTLKNNWVVSVSENNFGARKPGPKDNVRGMAAKDGKMYFINRALAAVVVVDGATGEMLEPIAIRGEHMFEIQDEEGMWKTACTLPYNDIHFDNADNCLIGCMAYIGETFFVYKLDLTTGETTELIKERLYDNPAFKDNGYRLDAFGVYGDVNGDAIIMAADANSLNVYKWKIVDGQAGKAEQIKCAANVVNFGTAPRICPVSENLFYVDGWNTLPMLFDMSGALKGGFINSPNGVEVTNNEGDTCTMNAGHNGVVEFQYGGERFLLMAATNTYGTPASSFALYKFINDDRIFADLEPLWYFPANGMGKVTNGCRVAIPAVEIKNNEATLYVYTNNNGYASYTFSNKTLKGNTPTFVEDDAADCTAVRKIFRGGQVYIFRGGKTYTITGVAVM